MSRFFAPISEHELARKILKAAQTSSFDYCVEEEALSSNPIQDIYRDVRNIFDLTPTTQKDTAKVEVDRENTECEPGRHPRIEGFHTLPNGLTFCGGWAAGDWESPVFAIVYWDGSKLRAYIPEKGNTYNRTTKTAYGNAEEEEDIQDLKKQYPECFPPKRKAEDSAEQCFHNLDWNDDAILADIEARILPR